MLRIEIFCEMLFPSNAIFLQVRSEWIFIIIEIMAYHGGISYCPWNKNNHEISQQTSTWMLMVSTIVYALTRFEIQEILLHFHFMALGLKQGIPQRIKLHKKSCILTCISFTACPIITSLFIQMDKHPTYLHSMYSKTQ